MSGQELEHLDREILISGGERRKQPRNPVVSFRRLDGRAAPLRVAHRLGEEIEERHAEVPGELLQLQESRAGPRRLERAVVARAPVHADVVYQLGLAIIGRAHVG